MASAAKSLIDRRLYRSLLRASKPFSRGSPNGVVLSCLFHRAGVDDKKWDEFLRETLPQGEQESYARKSSYRSLFQKLLSEVISNDQDGIRQMVFPRNVHSDKLVEVIRREFRDDGGADLAISSEYDTKTRREAAFVALREINKKLAWADKLRRSGSTDIHPHQAAKDVSPLPTLPPSSYLRPGAYLIAHPNMRGYFRRSVICILDHKNEESEDDGAGYGTYGLIINRPCKSTDSGRILTLEEVIRPLPDNISQAFGVTNVMEGGPVQVSLQMLHCSTPEQEELEIAGHPLSTIPRDDDEDGAKSTAVHTNRAVYYNGDIANAASAVISGRLDRDDVSFFVGASSWSIGQLESEIERGSWLPARGPVEIAHSGVCDHDPTPKGKPRPKADLWLSMLSACGRGEAELAHLVFNDDGEDELGYPCDDDYTYLVSFKD